MTKKISWKDFRLEPLKPNLIKNGWDDLKPYGTEGEETKAPLEVFDKNYAPNIVMNGDFRFKEKNWLSRKEGIISFANNNLSITYSGTMFNHVYQDINVTSGHKYYLKTKYKLKDNLTMSRLGITSNPQANYPKYKGVEFGNKPGDNEVSAVVVGEADKKHLGIFTQNLSPENQLTIEYILAIDLTKRFGKGNEPTKEWCDKNLKYYANWKDIPEKDKPVRAWDNMAVHMTPLKNGLTRIQTWGGNHRLKLTYSNPIGKTYSFSTYLKTNNFIEIMMSDDVGVKYTEHDGLVSIKGGFKLAMLLRLFAKDKSDNLDFIASDPVIVEGDEPNPIMIVDTLSDGREHVKVYGATPETKLVYEEPGFKGDLYSFETEVENKGAHLKLTSTIGDLEQEISDGLTNIQQEGNLTSSKIEIKVGASNDE